MSGRTIPVTHPTTTPRTTRERLAHRRGVTRVRELNTDRELASLILDVLRRDEFAVGYIARAGITLDDLWAIVRRGRR